MKQKSHFLFFLLFKIQNQTDNKLHLRTFLKGKDILVSKKVRKVLWFVIFNISLKLKIALRRLQYEYVDYLYSSNTSLTYNTKRLIQLLFSTDKMYYYRITEAISSAKQKLYLFKELFFLYIMNIIIIQLTCTFSKTNVSSMPNKRTLKTVIRSPHIDKRSREQFESVSYHSFIQYPNFINTLDPLILNLLSDYGVEIYHEYSLNR